VPRLQDLLESGFAWHLADRVVLEIRVLESGRVAGDDVGVVYGFWEYSNHAEYYRECFCRV
jgi:hypothetical protein